MGKYRRGGCTSSSLGRAITRHVTFTFIETID
jgi:hypothetical protein